MTPLQESTSHPNSIEQYRHIILFDGVCHLCSNWVQFVAARDPEARFKFAQVQSEAGKMILQWCNLPTDTFDTMVYVEDCQAYFRSAAFLKIIADLPMPYPLLGVGWILPRVIRDWLYDRIALNRYRLFGRSDTCMIPDKELEKRFI